MAYEFRNLELLQNTGKAYHVQQTRRNETIKQWIPISVCTYKKFHPPQEKGGREIQYVDLQIEDWFVEKDDCKLMI